MKEINKLFIIWLFLVILIIALILIISLIVNILSQGLYDFSILALLSWLLFSLTWFPIEYKYRKNRGKE